MSDELRRRLRGLPVFPEQLPELDLKSSPAQPGELFLDWLEQAISAGLLQPHAFSLATAAVTGAPSSRMLILKNLEQDRWYFATSRLSRKGLELAQNPQAAMNFYHAEPGRQVRVCGPVRLLSAEASAQDWQERPSSDGAKNPDWQLYALEALEVEFWQARHDRQHRRLIYRRDAPDAAWSSTPHS
ncbi:pyridoxamine 5'-phosphate oxidase [Psychromicrobium silvestre]|uniref:Pyridoxamine 5'-phosphate oxidase n=1 Tax=Psychromicrobium silvestre TaxID=1645614 RepID=A0A7Y9LQM8_9MICC|nr:pyridoxamine 5'-phosphate oxidase family protein [Psychromicrobium silvestre]NYE93811.1 pyridoxamine 5'-phosphate oxidase [Psychromicrobium silvestre]